jgi:hypothetical protein
MLVYLWGREKAAVIRSFLITENKPSVGVSAKTALTEFSSNSLV